MRDYGLNFINSSDLYNHTKEIIEQYRFNIDLKEFNKNLIDPIKLTFDIKAYNKSIEDIINLEIIRQIDKTTSNNIGYFQQNIFKYLYNIHSKKTLWKVPKEGYDIVNEQDNIFVEMKNKHNTMNSSSSQKTYMRMQNTILKNSNAMCYLVEVIAKNSQNIPWVISLDKNSVSDNRIRRISIDKFYELVTENKTAFKELIEVLPCVMDDIILNIEASEMQSTVIDELKDIDENILKSLYLLSFKKYEGFETLII